MAQKEEIRKRVLPRKIIVTLIDPWILDIHFDHKRIDHVIRDSSIPDVNDTLVKGGGIADEDLKALVMNWNL